MKKLINDCKNTWKSLGKLKTKISKDEKLYLSYRRSIYACKNIDAGEKISLSNIKIIRPNRGLAPNKLKKILGKKVKRNVKFASPITNKIF